MPTQQVKVKCRKCGKEAIADQFILDHETKMMVCPNCIREKKNSTRVQTEFKAMRAKQKEETENKPPGWDMEDDYLERMAKAKAKSIIQVERVDEEKVRYKCQRCSFQFIINLTRNSPGKCPFCGTLVQSYSIR